MSERRRLQGWGRTEVVLSARAWDAALPSTFVAFFYPKACAPACREKTEADHRRFLAEFPEMSGGRVPVLELDQFDWRTPFSAPRGRPRSVK